MCVKYGHENRESHVYETMYYTCLRIPSRLDWLHRETLCIAGSCARPDAGVVIVTPGSGPEYEEHGALASPLARQAMAYAYDYHSFVTYSQGVWQASQWSAPIHRHWS